MADSYGRLGNVAYLRGDYDEAARQHQRALDIFERLGNADKTRQTRPGRRRRADGRQRPGRRGHWQGISRHTGGPYARLLPVSGVLRSDPHFDVTGPPHRPPRSAPNQRGSQPRAETACRQRLVKPFAGLFPDGSLRSAREHAGPGAAAERARR